MPDGVSYNHETVSLDGETFRRCEFRACRLVYSGGAPAQFDNCKFDTCEWKLQGAAALTVAHLRGMWNASGKSAVQVIIKEITGAR
jgi:hypothetical protein